jgi:DNA-directed RNA polymerase beta' subunit
MTAKVFPYKDISSVQFGILSPEEIIERSVCKVDNSKFTGPNSVYDLRMGSMEQDQKCVSCGSVPKICPGHSAYIELNHHVLHPMYLRQITNFLKCLCVKCHRLVLSEEHLKLDGVLRYQTESRFEKIVEKLEKIDSCYYCQSPKPKIAFQQKTSDISMKFKDKKIVLKEIEIKNIFDHMIDDDVRLLGFNPTFMHPKNLVLSVIPVIPPRARPYVMAADVTCDDDITTQYVEIVKANRNLIDENTNDSKRDKIIQTLNFRIKTLMNNSQGKARHTNGRPLKGIKERLSGKDGLIRSNLMGKRRNQSGRSVISADPSARTDELVVPEKIARNLTMPEIVTMYNREVIQKLVDDGKANFVIRDEGKTKINLNYAMYKKGTQLLWGDKVMRDGRELVPFSSEYKQIRPNFELKEGDTILRNGEIISAIDFPKKRPFRVEIGDTVERHLKNGDIVLFNRQPTLHRGSMLAKRIIVRGNKTFRFNLASTKSFNADYDGDF